LFPGGEPPAVKPAVCGPSESNPEIPEGIEVAAEKLVPFHSTAVEVADGTDPPKITPAVCVPKPDASLVV
jgi:hypothetical protein